MSQDAEQLRELIRKYEQRQRDLEERELQARDRLTMLETYMPAVLSWNAWSALQAQQVTPGEVTRIITGQQLLPMDESYTRRLQELENVVRGIKDSDELESVGPKPSGSLTPEDIENMKKLQEIATNEMQLKRRIQSMERKELMYLAALQKADELRMRAEGITSGQEFTSPTIVEAGSSAEGLQRRVVELEAEVNRLKKKAEVLEAENEKLLHMISDGTQEGECQCGVEGLPEVPSVPKPAPAAPAEAQVAEEPPAAAEEAVAVQELQPAEGPEAVEETEVVEAAEPVVTEAAEPEVTEAAEPEVTEAAEPEVTETAEGAAEEATEVPAEAAPVPEETPAPPAPQEGGAADSCICAEPEPKEPVCTCAAGAPMAAAVTAPPPGAAAPPAGEAAPAAAPPRKAEPEVDYGPRVDHITDCDTEFDEFQAVPEHILKAIAEEEAALYAKAFPPVMPVITRPPPAAPPEPAAAEPAAAAAPVAAAGPVEAAAPGVCSCVSAVEVTAEVAAPPATEAAPPAGEAAAPPEAEGAPPEEVAPEGAAPEEAAPETAAPEEAAPEAAAPEAAAPEAAAPEEAAPEAAAPEEAAPEAAAPEEATPEAAAPEAAAPEAAAPEAAAPEAAAVEAPTAAPAAAAGDQSALDQLIEMTKALQAAFEHIRGCPSCSSTVGPTLEGIIDTLGRITSSLTEAHGGAPGAVAAPFTAPVSAGEQDMFPSAPIGDEEECVPFNVVSSDPECGILCWRGSEEFVDAQGEPPQPREYATSDPNCTILCWDDIAFEKVKQMPLAVKPPELESKGLEEGQLLTTVGLGAATTEPLSVSADIKDTSGPAVSATVERSSQESFEYSEECYSRLTAEDFLFGEQGSFALEQGKLCAFTDSELDLPFEEDAESVYLDPQERLFQNEFPECLSQAPVIKAVQVTAEKPIVLGEKKVVDAGCTCSGVCTCSITRIEVIKEPLVAQKEVPSATGIAAFDEKVSELSPVQVATEEPVVLGEGKDTEEVCECEDVCTCSTTAIAPVIREPVSPEKEVPAATGVSEYDEKVSESSPVQGTTEEPIMPGEGKVVEEKVTAPLGKVVCTCSGVCTCCMQCTGAAPLEKGVPAGIVPVEKEIPLAEAKLSEESVTESLYTRVSAEEFYFGDQGSFVLEASKICEFTDSELDLPFEEEVESVYLGSSERLFKDEFPESANIPALIVKPHVVMELAPVTAEVPAATRIGAFDEKAELTPVQVIAKEPTVLGDEKVVKAGCACSGVCTCSVTRVAPVEKEVPIAVAPVEKEVPTGTTPVEKEVPLAKEKLSEESVTESLYTRISAEEFYFGDQGSFVLEASKICEFTDSELDLPFEEEVESVYLGSSERLFKDEFPDSANIPALIVKPHVVMELAPVTAEVPPATGTAVFDEKATEEPTVLGDEKVIKAGCACSGVCTCSVTGVAPVEKEAPTTVAPVEKEVPRGVAQVEKEAPLVKGKLSEESVTESIYTRHSAEDFYFGEFGSYVLEEPSKICEFTESELELPFEEEVESVYLGSTERLFQNEFPENAKLPPFTVEPVVMTDVMVPQAVLKGPETSETVPVGMITPLAGLEPPTRLETPTRLEAAEGYRIERTTSSTGELRDEIYFDVLGRTIIEPGPEQVIADISQQLEEPLAAIKKMEDEIMSEIPGILSELLARCEGAPGGKPELSEVKHVLSELLAKCAAVDADKQAVMETVITEVMAKGGGLEAGDVQDILKDLLGKCEVTVPGTVEIPVIGPPGTVEIPAIDLPGTVEIPAIGLAAEGREAPDVHAILSDVITKCGDKGKIEPSDIARILSEVITSQVAIQPQVRVPEQPATPQIFEQQEIEQKRVCACASRKFEVAPDRAVEETEPQVQEERAEGPSEREEQVMPVAGVSGSDASFEYTEDSYSRVTAADFPFGETGSCILEPPKEYGFTDSELELPFEEEEPIVELGPEERLFQNEFTGVVTATHKPPQILEQQEIEQKRVCACASRKSEVAPDRAVEETEPQVQEERAEGPSEVVPDRAVEETEPQVEEERAEETCMPEEVIATDGVPVTAEEQEEETFFEAIGETLPEEKIVGETILTDERSEGETEGDLETQLASLRQRVSKKSKEIIEIKTLLSQLQQQQTRLEGKMGVEPSQFPEMVMAEEDYTKPIALGPGTRASPSEMQAAIASLQDKCRVKDHMIGAMVEELRARAQSGIWNELKTRIASPEMPQPDYTRSQVVEYLTSEAQFPQLTPESTGACACSGDAKPTSMAVSLPPAREERACVATPPLSLQVPVSTCTCPGDFKIVRKIGADSLLLGWQVPATSANLAGYDIYVNGVLQCKVWSGTRNRALLHCLDLSSPMVILLYGRTTSGQLSGPARITYPGEA